MVVVVGQLPSYKANPNGLPLPLVVKKALLNRNTTELALAVNVYHISLVVFPPHDIWGVEWVAPEVLAVMEVLQVAANGCVVMGIAPLHSSLAGVCPSNADTYRHPAIITNKVKVCLITEYLVPFKIL